MRRVLWIVLAVVAATLAGGVGYSVLARNPEWTTSSPAALAEFEAATDARMKFYHGEAIDHLEKAVELDPGFVIAKLMLANYLRGERKDDAKTLFEEVFAADLSGITPRERMLVERSRALAEGRGNQVREILAAYVDRYPDDPYGLELAANTAWSEGDLMTAERMFRHILEIRPNWVGAYNMLGYVAMRQGRFVEAEEYLTSYRFIAPDQANPNDSLGELFTLLGRYGDAEASLERALEIKPDFYHSYYTLFLIKSLQEDQAGMRAVIRRADAGEVWSPEMLQMFQCTAELVELEGDREWQAIVDRADTGCVTEGSPADWAPVLTHRAACLLERWEIAATIEERLRAMVGKADKLGKLDRSILEGALAHMESVRALAEGRTDDAIARCRAADEGLAYSGAGLGVFKLMNRLLLVEMLRARGDEIEAHRVLSQVRAVNPALAGSFEERGMSLLGLGRG